MTHVFYAIVYEISAMNLGFPAIVYGISAMNAPDSALKK
ncbi:hypothetical protein DFR56_109100 [Pseudogracilibacillus auburnensis]|uniref:Uncharacterized protein n=1 Tax=Pseudogracilibacillus auburnensis TaxID=1494959 RepID=A0A2V3VVG2_9BACI|nr:hypothetical protein DFR56_109100 [Pseudogracilibacillus auburnensis]